MKEKISKKKLQEFGILIGFAFPILIGWILPSLSGHGFRSWTLWIGIPGLILGIIEPGLLYYPYKWWIALGHALGWVNSHIILGLVFIIVLQPISYIMYLRRYDPLKRQREKGNTYREKRKNYNIDFTRIF